MEFGRDGQIVTGDYMRTQRERKGLCITCRRDPIRCYEIKKRWGGLRRDSIPLTEPHQVLNGICLICHPEKDPDNERNKKKEKKKKRTTQKRPKDRDGRRRRRHVDLRDDNPRHQRHPENHLTLPVGVDQGDDFIRRSNSLKNPPMKPLPKQKSNDAKPRRSMPATASHLLDVQGHEISFEEEGEPKSPPEQGDGQAEQNIFGQPIPAAQRPSGKRSSRSRPSQDQHCNHKSSHIVGGLCNPHEEELDEGPCVSPSHTNRVNNHTCNSRNEYPGNYIPYNMVHTIGQKEEEIPIPTPATITDIQNNNSSSADDESLDILAKLCQQHMTMNPRSSTPIGVGGAINSTVKVDDDGQSIISGITTATCFQGRPSMATATLSGHASSRIHDMDLSVISETSTGASSEQQLSMVSHQIHEPIMEQDTPKPAQQLSTTIGDLAPASATFESGNIGGMEESAIPSTPKLSSLRDFVEMCTGAGIDSEAIVQITQALIIDNAATMKAFDDRDNKRPTVALVLYCLTTLWILARKSDENKRTIIFADFTFGAITEAMRIHCDEKEVQARACGVLWSLSMDLNERKYVAEEGGIDAILDAILVHAEEDRVQVMALGALKVLSFDGIGKEKLRSKGALLIVANIMQRHGVNPTIQTDGCVILSNLVVVDATQGVESVTEQVVEATVNGILSHPNSLEVHEAACFALRRFASSATNVELIRRNRKITVSLELAFQKHPDEVGVNILTLWKRLRLNSR